MSQLRTEFPFTLPKGYVDGDGQVHRDGSMRLATARDELEPLNDPKVRDADDPYLTVIVLSRVITRLGPHSRLSPRDVEGLFAADLAYLQDVYAAINYGTDAEIDRALAGPAPATASPAPASPSAAAAAATPVSDAARQLASAAPLPPSDDTGQPDPAPQAEEPTRAPRRTHIEEVGRSSGRPGSAP